MKIVDVSVPIHDAMTVYRGNPPGADPAGDDGGKEWR